MRPNRYVVEQVLTCEELSWLLSHATAHLDAVKDQATALREIIRRVETRLFAMAVREEDQVYVVLADGP